MGAITLLGQIIAPLQQPTSLVWDTGVRIICLLLRHNQSTPSLPLQLVMVLHQHKTSVPVVQGQEGPPVLVISQEEGTLNQGPSTSEQCTF